MGKIKEHFMGVNEQMANITQLDQYGGDAQIDSSATIKRVSTRQRLKDRIRESKEHIYNMENSLTEMDNMKFSEGDVVIHKDYGICIIDDITTKSEAGPYPKPNYEHMNGIRGYKLIGRGLGNSGVWVNEEDVVPFSDSAKVLYGQKK